MMKKRFGVSVLILLILSLAVYAATRPSQGGSNNDWGTELNSWLDVAHDSQGNIKAGYITSGMIQDATVDTADLANYSVTNAKIALSAVNGSQVSTASALNVSNLILTGANQTGSYSMATANVTGIFYNRSMINLPSLANNSCFMVLVNMTGIPAGASCIPIMDPGLAAGNPNNLTATGTNSTTNNCRLIVCNMQFGQAVDPPLLSFGAIGIATGSDLTAPVPTA